MSAEPKYTNIATIIGIAAIAIVFAGVMLAATYRPPPSATCITGGLMGHNEQMFYRVWSDGTVEWWHKETGWTPLRENETP